MNTKEEIIAFKPMHDYFIGIDSDGTAFDSMNIKHIKSMYPAALEVWDIGENRALFECIWYKFNLYSVTRGVNRFLGLLHAFEMMQEKYINIQGINIDPFKDFINNSGTLSNTALQSWIDKNPCKMLEDVMRWSKRSDELFDEFTQGLLPFANAEAAIRIMSGNADLMVVSSASGKGLDKDWSFSGLSRYLALLAGQETGSKKEQLKMGALGKYNPDKILMIGDAPGDFDAAKEIDALFFPIMPGKEEESWQFLIDNALSCFFTGKYKGEYEKKLVDNFFEFLEQ